MLKQLGLHLLLTHSVPAWTLVVMACLFLGLETARLLLGHRASDAHGAWLEHSRAQHDTVAKALEILGNQVAGHGPAGH